MPPVARGHLRPVSAGARTAERFPYNGEVVLCHVITRKPLQQNAGKPEGENKKLCPHPCVVISVTENYVSLEPPILSWSVDVFICRSFHDETNPVQYVAGMEKSMQNLHIPLPPPKGFSQAPTPTSFGPPLNLNLVPDRYSWVVAHVRKGIRDGPERICE
jgi:hypothetical protein